MACGIDVKMCRRIRMPFMSRHTFVAQVYDTLGERMVIVWYRAAQLSHGGYHPKLSPEGRIELFHNHNSSEGIEG